MVRVLKWSGVDGLYAEGVGSFYWSFARPSYEEQGVRQLWVMCPDAEDPQGHTTRLYVSENPEQATVPGAGLHLERGPGPTHTHRGNQDGEKQRKLGHPRLARVSQERGAPGLIHGSTGPDRE